MSVGRWALAGVGVFVGALAGFAFGLVVASNAKAEWVEAAGTWVGGLGTIAAVLASVHALLVSQRNRVQDEAQRLYDADVRARQEQEEENRARLAKARLVTYAVSGGGGFGPEGDFTMQNVHVRLWNASDASLSNVRIVVGDSDFEWSPQAGLLMARTNVEENPEVEGKLPLARLSEATDKPLTSYPTRLEFTLDDVDYQSVNQGPAYVR